MGRIDDIFRQLHSTGAKGLMPFIPGGWPTVQATTAIIEGMADAGACICEVGLPFSDPIADGPVIAGAMHETLEHGTTIDDVLEAVRTARDNGATVGLVAMASHSIVHARGDDAFINDLAQAGFDGVIIPDIDTDRAAALLPAIDAAGMSCSHLIAPTTSAARTSALCEGCRGFVYVLARAGITGTATSLDGLGPHIDALRQQTDLPLALGFGISDAATVAQAVSTCDAAIVGSAIVRVMQQADDPVAAALAFVADLAGGLDIQA